jgi:hypothetical protein
MALTKKGKWWHAASAADLDEYLLKHVPGRLRRGKQYRVAHCRCGACKGEAFDLFLDDAERALRVCTACEGEHPVCDLDKKFDMVSAGEIVCTCMYSECEVAVGFCLAPVKSAKAAAGRPAEPAVTYLYVAGRCTHCGLCGVYAEWPAAGSFPIEDWCASA